MVINRKAPDPGQRDRRRNVEGKHNIHNRSISRFGNKDKEEFTVSEAVREIMEEEDGFEGLDEVIVLDDASAAMVLRRLKVAEERYDRMKAWYDSQIKNLKDTRDGTRAWAEACLKPYMEMAVEAGLTTGKKIKSFDMPGGTLKLSAQDPEYEVADDELVPWLEANKLDKFVAVKKEARWGDFKDTLKDEKKKIRTVTAEDGTLRVVTADGEVVPGVKATVRDDKFSIKVK